jgi:DNA-binding GntR family transcriptional regulator
VSRTLVREALMQLQARGFVEVRPRKGWYVVEPSFDEAREAFAARRVIETGMLRDAGRPLQSAIKRLRQHVADERQAIREGDAATRTFLLADFHVCLAECAGNRLLADVMRDLTARTTLVALLYQSTHDAQQSCDEHAAIVDALAKGDTARAEKLMARHIGNVQGGLNESATSEGEELARLRASLTPLRLAKP